VGHGHGLRSGVLSPCLDSSLDVFISEEGVQQIHSNLIRKEENRDELSDGGWSFRNTTLCVHSLVQPGALWNSRDDVSLNLLIVGDVLGSQFNAATTEVVVENSEDEDGVRVDDGEASTSNGEEEVVDEGDGDHTQDKHAEAIGVEIDSAEELIIEKRFPVCFCVLAGDEAIMGAIGASEN